MENKETPCKECTKYLHEKINEVQGLIDLSIEIGTKKEILEGLTKLRESLFSQTTYLIDQQVTKKLPKLTPEQQAADEMAYKTLYPYNGE